MAGCRRGPVLVERLRCDAILMLPAQPSDSLDQKYSARYCSCGRNARLHARRAAPTRLPCLRCPVVPVAIKQNADEVGMRHPAQA